MKKDLDNRKKHSYTLKNTTAKVVNYENIDNIIHPKYEKLKTRLSELEKAKETNRNFINQINAEKMRQNVMIMSGTYLRGGVNDSIENVQHAAKSQQAYPIHLALPREPEPKFLKIPPPPPPPFKPLQAKCELPSQFPKYVINTELLKSMAKQLRRPDGDNIRKIPRRKDMMIPTKVTQTAEEDASI
ncbi:uncharacterized protein LOC112685409 [Sipha flava]|uniref:Uncharacterized protein LOC112685409 n=1 Tax=Sipha flava TaxID=143950 RepID=A0A8B8FQ43_9HEMI|nr:uncharacterized protein LOC112685409 [Sipha flava]